MESTAYKPIHRINQNGKDGNARKVRQQAADRTMQASRFRVMCADAGLTLDAVAQALRVTPRTVRYWFSGKTAVPYSAYRLVRILGRYELPDPAWKGWLMHSGRLWSPEGHGFIPADSNWWALLCSRARLWTEQFERGRQFDMLMMRTGRDYAGMEDRVRAELQALESARLERAGRSGAAASDAARRTPTQAQAEPTGAAGRAAKPPGLNLSLGHFGTRGAKKAPLQRGNAGALNCEQSLTKEGQNHGG